MKPIFKRVLKWIGILVLVPLVVALVAYIYIRREMPGHTAPSSPPGKIEVSGDPTLDALRRGLEYLRVHQETDGHFVAGRLSPKPAFTALVVEAFLTSPDGYTIDKHPFLRKAVDGIVAEQKESGSIHSEIPGMSFKSYSTSVALLALNRVKDQRYAAVITKAAHYLKGDQHPSGSVNEGGFGYGGGSRADLNNTCTILEALEASGIPKDDPVYKNARAFIAHCQNRNESNELECVGWGGGVEDAVEEQLSAPLACR